jgi:hypothetical protein
MKNRVTIYHCQGRTDATDKANLYYIASPTARRIETDNEGHKIKIYGRKPAPLAVFEF